MRRINLATTPLLVVDVQNGFVNRHSRGAIPDIKALLKAWSAACGPVIITKFVNPSGSLLRTLIGWNRMGGPPQTDLASGIMLNGAKVFEKSTYSAFTSEVEELFFRNTWKELVVCGMCTEACVLKSAVDAFERGFVPIVVTTACSSSGGVALHQQGINILRTLIGPKQLVTLDELLSST